MTEGPILRVLIAFAVPMMIGSLFTDLYNLVDMTIAGYTIGDSALAAISATSGIMAFINATSRGFNIGNAISVSNAFGEGNMEKTRKSLAGMLSLCYVLSLTLTLLLCIFIKPLMRLINTPTDLFGDSWNYIIVIIIGLTFTMSYDLFACAFRALGNSKIPLYLLILCSFLNVGLDLLFMKGLRMGVMGAALATVISQLLSAILSLIIFYRIYPELHFKLSDFTGVWPTVKDMIPIGISGALTNSMYSIGWIFMQGSINALGQNSLVAYAAYKKVSMFAIIPSVSLANTMATFSAQNYGAKNFDRITKGILTSCGFSFLVNLVTLTVTVLLGKPIVRLITNTQSPVVLEQAYHLLLVTVSFIWAQTVIMAFRLSIQGMRKKLIPWLGTCFEMVLRILFALVFIPMWGYIAIGLAESSCWVLGGIMMVICYFVILKKEKKLYESSTAAQPDPAMH